MKVPLGPLAKSGLEARGGDDLPVAIGAACAYYLGRLDSDCLPAPLPDFLLKAPPRPEIEVPVEGPIEEALVAQADRQGVGPAELAAHAVLVYLADVTSR